MATFDSNYDSIKRFVLEAKNYLKPGGRVVIEFSKTIGEYDKLKEFFDKSGLKFEMIKKEVVDYGEIMGDVEFELFEGRG